MEILNSNYNHFGGNNMLNSQMLYQPSYSNYGHYENRSSLQRKRKHDFMDVVASPSPFVVQKKPFRTRNDYDEETLPTKIEEIEDESTQKKNGLVQNQLISFSQPTTFFLDKDILGNLVLSSTIYSMNPTGKELVPVHTSKLPTLTPGGRFSTTTSDRHKVTIENDEDGPRIVEIKEEDEDNEPRIVEITDEEEKEINENRSRKRREPVSPTPIDAVINSSEDAMDLD